MLWATAVLPTASTHWRKTAALPTELAPKHSDSTALPSGGDGIVRDRARTQRQHHRGECGGDRQRFAGERGKQRFGGRAGQRAAHHQRRRGERCERRRDRRSTRGLAGADRGGAPRVRPAGAHRARERRISGDWRIRNESPSAIHSMSKDVRLEQKQIFAPSLSEVRFVPQSGHRGLAPYVRSVPIADISRITAVAPSGVAHARHEIRCCRGLQSTNARSRSR